MGPSQVRKWALCGRNRETHCTPQSVKSKHRWSIRSRRNSSRVVDATYMAARRAGLSAAGADPDAPVVRTFRTGTPSPPMSIPLYSGPVGHRHAHHWARHPRSSCRSASSLPLLNRRATSGRIQAIGKSRDFVSLNFTGGRLAGFSIRWRAAEEFCRSGRHDRRRRGEKLRGRARQFDPLTTDWLDAAGRPASLSVRRAAEKVCRSGRRRWRRRGEKLRGQQGGDPCRQRLLDAGAGSAEHSLSVGGSRKICGSGRDDGDGAAKSYGVSKATTRWTTTGWMPCVDQPFHLYARARAGGRSSRLLAAGAIPFC